MTSTARGVLVANLCATWFLVGLILVVQFVHYPLFKQVAAENWDTYHTRHVSSITAIVAPTMFVEALTAAALVFIAKRFSPRVKACVWIAGVLVLANWLSTIGIVVPLHNRLGTEYDPAVIDKLISANWVRTIAWSLRGVLMGYVAFRAQIL